MSNLERLILDRHPLPKWAAFAETRTGTGYGRGREQRIDVSAFNCWPSGNGYRIAYEVKRTRGDFLAELDTPEKRAHAERYYHETWFVTLPGVAQIEELPVSWGLLITTKKGDKLRRLRQAATRDPEDLPWNAACSVLRRVAEREQSVSGRDARNSVDYERKKLIVANNLIVRRERSLYVQEDDIRRKKQEAHEILCAADSPRRTLAALSGVPIEDVTPENVRGLVQKAAASSVRDLTDRALQQLRSATTSIERLKEEP